MPSRLHLIVMFAALAGVPSVQAASACHAVSGEHTRPLVELYTSEGCDSCPPAERWLSSRFGAEGGASQAIALAFHVDYWDRLGWVDRFASASYTARQHDAMRANGASFVYTPQILLQGRDLAAWRSGGAASIDAAAATPARASIALDVAAGELGLVVHADARIADGDHAGDAELFVAYADSGLVSDVKAGENRGVRLTHDHVVRALRLVGRANASRRVDATFTLPGPAERGTHPTLVAFVQRASRGDVLQALALPLDRCVPR
jgi:hypothetical protein